MKVRYTGNGQARIRYRDETIQSGEAINLKQRVAERLVGREDFEVAE